MPSAPPSRPRPEDFQPPNGAAAWDRAGRDHTAARDPPMSGFVGRAPAVDVQDALFVTALVLSDGTAGPDVVPSAARHRDHGSDRPLQRRSRSDAEGCRAPRHRHPAEHVRPSCSHTHYGPVVAEHGDMPGGRHPLVRAYRTTLMRIVAELRRSGGSCAGPRDRASRPWGVPYRGQPEVAGRPRPHPHGSEPRRSRRPGRRRDPARDPSSSGDAGRVEAARRRDARQPCMPSELPRSGRQKHQLGFRRCDARACRSGGRDGHPVPAGCRRRHRPGPQGRRLGRFRRRSSKAKPSRIAIRFPGIHETIRVPHLSGGDPAARGGWLRSRRCVPGRTGLGRAHRRMGDRTSGRPRRRSAGLAMWRFPVTRSLSLTTLQG